MLGKIEKEMSGILKSFPSRDIILMGGPYHGTNLGAIISDSFEISQAELTMGVYQTTRNIVNDREVFEWKPNQ